MQLQLLWLTTLSTAYFARSLFILFCLARIFSVVNLWHHKDADKYLSHDYLRMLSQLLLQPQGCTTYASKEVLFLGIEESRMVTGSVTLHRNQV